MKLVASVVGGAAASLAILVGFALVDGASPQEIIDDPVVLGIVAGSGAVSGAVGALIGG